MKLYFLKLHGKSYILKTLIEVFLLCMLIYCDSTVYKEDIFYIVIIKFSIGDENIKNTQILIIILLEMCHIIHFPPSYINAQKYHKVLSNFSMQGLFSDDKILEKDTVYRIEAILANIGCTTTLQKSNNKLLKIEFYL